MKAFGKTQQKSLLIDSESLTTDLDLSVSSLVVSEVKKADDEWNWNDDEHLDSGKSTSTVAADDLSHLQGDDDKIDDDIEKMKAEEECMLTEMTETEEDSKFIIVSPQCSAGQILDAGKIGGLSNVVHRCKSCNRQFARKQSLVRHEKMRCCGAGQHSCSICGEAFDRRLDLDAHMAARHVSQPPSSSVVKCSTCHMECSSLGEFNSHLEESPDCAQGDSQSRGVIFISSDPDGINYRPFLCDICGKNFSTSLSLRMHHKLHTGERPFACGTCGKSFVQKVQLTQVCLK